MTPRNRECSAEHAQQLAELLNEMTEELSLRILESIGRVYDPRSGVPTDSPYPWRN
jgi:hypothetical protein